MGRHFALPLALLFIALGVSSNAQSEPTPSVAPSTAEPAADAPPVVYYDVGRSFALNCTVPAPPGGSASYVWRKNDTALEEVKELTKRYELVEGGAVMRITGRSNEEDYGVYSCGLVGAPAALVWDMRGRPHAKLAPNSNVIENQALKLTCKVIGKPYPPVTWTFSNSTLNGTEVQAALGERATLRPNEQGVEGGELVLSAAQRSDAGEYSCAPVGGAAAVTVVRVKDQFAALWPFLGICAEVFVLCAVILVYEKRRTKPELDDSDTDNHEQKKS